MARNRYDVDEVLETPFDFAHLKRSFVYIKKYKGKMITALVLSVFAAISGLLGPTFSSICRSFHLSITITAHTARSSSEL